MRRECLMHDAVPTEMTSLCDYTCFFFLLSLRYYLSVNVFWWGLSVNLKDFCRDVLIVIWGDS